MQNNKFQQVFTMIRSIFYGNAIQKSLSCYSECCDKESVVNYQKSRALSSLSEDRMLGSLDEQPVVCTLNESKLADRKNNLLKDLFSKVRNANEIEMGYIFSFPYEERLLMIITEYIIAEKSCCPFFNFDIKLQQTNDILLEITGPKEAKKMIEMFLSEIKVKS